jgi:hypothetical protein
LEIASRNSDLLPQRQDLIGREVVADVLVGGLQLRRPPDDLIQCRPIDSARRGRRWRRRRKGRHHHVPRYAFITLGFSIDMASASLRNLESRLTPSPI